MVLRKALLLGLIFSSCQFSWEAHACQIVFSSESSPEIHPDFTVLSWRAPAPPEIIRVKEFAHGTTRVRDLHWPDDQPLLTHHPGATVPDPKARVILNGHPEMATLDRGALNGVVFDLGFEAHLLKPPRQALFTTNILADPATTPEIQRLGRLDRRSDGNLRFQAIRTFPLGSLVTSPGHRVLRNQATIQGMIDTIHSNGRLNAKERPVVINVITREDQKIQGIDIQDGHHRLLAYLLADPPGGKKFETLGDLPSSELRILVNGYDDQNRVVLNKVPFWAINLSFLKNPTFVASRLGAHIALWGHESNFHHGGSRNTLGHTAKLTQLLPKAPRVGLIFLPPRASLNEASYQKLISTRQRDFDEILVIPLGNANQVNEAIQLTRDHSYLNLYLGRLTSLKEYTNLDAQLDFTEMTRKLVRQLYATELDSIEVLTSPEPQ